MVHIHYTLICSYLCSAEQNFFEEQQWMVYSYDRSRLVSKWEKVLFGSQVAVLQVVRQFFSVLQVAALVLLCV